MELLIITITGSCIGSFLHMLQTQFIATSPYIQSFKTIGCRRSYCSTCQHQLKSWQLIPLFSWIWLQGRCYYCQATIPRSHLYFELIFSCLFAFGHLWFPDCQSLIIFLLLSCWFCLLALYDIKFFLLPDYLTLTLLTTGVLISYTDYGILTVEQAIINSSLLFISLSILAYLFYYHQGYAGLGFGDIKLSAALGCWFKFEQLPLIFIISSLLALIYFAIIWYNKRKTFIKIPFGPFLLFGAWSVLIYNYPR
ncbi:MAG: prepilin peptidase [Candidatus Schmidhempelia sp.]|nr:prepilin peptidase [Candidatus Schmidhempelia sp.]